jgi:hypothetical protein
MISCSTFNLPAGDDPPFRKDRARLCASGQVFGEPYSWAPALRVPNASCHVVRKRLDTSPYLHLSPSSCAL